MTIIKTEIVFCMLNNKVFQIRDPILIHANSGFFMHYLMKMDNEKIIIDNYIN